MPGFVGSQSGLERLAAFVAVLANGLRSPPKSERGRVSHLPANPIQCAGAEFHRHESVGRERAFERACLPTAEAKARIVIGMAENDNDVFAAPSQQIEPMPDQPSTDALSPMFWRHGHGGQCRRRDGAAICFNEHPTEQDVPDDAPLQFGDN